MKNMKILKKHAKRIHIHKPSTFSSVERHNKFLASKKKVDLQNEKWKNSIMSRQKEIRQKVDDLKNKKHRAIKIVQDLEVLNKYTSKSQVNV